MKEFVNYLCEVEIYLRKHYPIRAGQAYYNVLYDIRPDIAHKLVGKPVDPFYNNDLIPVFLHHVANLWEDR